MPRPLRIEYPGACYHVICCGNARLPVFQADADKELLLDRMAYFAEICRVEFRAYCVMVNHVSSLPVEQLRTNIGSPPPSLQLGPVTISGLDSARSKMKLRLRKDKQLRHRVAGIQAVLANKSKSEDPRTIA